MGMSQFYGTPEERDEQESIATIHRDLELGVTFFDTAEPYGRSRKDVDRDDGQADCQGDRRDDGRARRPR